jgi:hypothetical protein
MPTTTLPIQEPTSEPQSVSEEQIIELLDNLDLSTPEEVVAQVATILEAELDSTLATQLATNSELLEVITPDQAEEIFASIDLDTLDPTQIDALVEAVQTHQKKSVKHLNQQSMSLMVLLIRMFLLVLLFLSAHADL